MEPPTVGSSADATRYGAIKGRVLNGATGEYLHGAVVRILGTALRGSTDIRGEYAISGVSVGTHTVQVSYIGLDAHTTEVAVQGNTARVVDFTLLGNAEVVEMEKFVVESTAAGSVAAINQQRVAEGVRNIVNEDQFGQMNDGNIGLALRRMPGLSVDTDGGTEVPRYVNIRGFDASLNSVTLDGNRLSSTETGAPSQRGGGTAYSGAARSFALDDIPADAITNVEIIKAPTPDMDGDALGGTVNLVTKTAFQREGQSIDYRVGGSYSSLRDEFGTNAALTYSNVYPAFGRDKGLGVSLTFSHYDQSEGFDNVDYDYVYLSTSGDIVDLSGIRPGDGAVSDYLEPQLAQDRERTGQLTIGLNEDTEYNNYDIDRRRLGFSGSFDMKVSDTTELYFKPTMNREKRVNTDLRHHLIMDSSDVTGLNHGDSATPLEQYVSLWGNFEPQYNAGNYFDFLEAAGDLGVEDQEFAPGDSLTAGGTTIVFDPGALVRLGGDPTHISTIRPGSGDLAARTTYNPDGSARGKVRYEGTFSTTDLDLMVLNFGGKTLTPWGEIEYNTYWSSTQKDHEEFQHEYERRGFQFGYTRENFYQPNYITENSSQVSRFAIPSQSAVDRFRDLDLEHKQYHVTEDIYGLNGDVRWNLPEQIGFTGYLKGGAKFRGLRRDYDYDEQEWDLASAFPYADYLFMNPYDPPYGNEGLAIPYVPDAPRIHREALPNNPQWFSEQFSANLNDSVINDYTAEEDTYAGYLMGNFKAGNFGVIFGGRYEYTSFSTTGFVLDGGPDTIEGVDASTINPFTMDERAVNPKQETHERSYNSFLPSMHLRYDFNDRLVGRVSWGKTYARPAIKDIVGSTFIVEDTTDHDNDPSTPEIVIGATANVPNFNLPPQRSENFDVSLEYYTQNGGYYQIAYFHKDMNNYAWSETFTTRDFPGYEGIDVEVSTPIANTDAVNQGIELAANVPLNFLPDPFRGFAINATYTYTDSQALYYTGRVGPTVGHSKNIYNASLEYRNRWFYGRVSYQYRSKYFENISISDFAEESEALAPEHQFIFDDVFMNPGTIDVELAFRWSQQLNFFVNVTNVTEKINASRQGYFQYPEDSYPHQRRFTFGLKGSF